MEKHDEIDCPRCSGTGTFVLDGREGCSERCKPCGGKGRVTREMWDDWCDYWLVVPPFDDSLPI
jgi:DnaJ-class molecular chaperone